jgi:hypothetical protein
MEAKDKNVRYRVILLTVSMINGLGELELVKELPRRGAFELTTQ